ncbi:MAG TPA: phosphoribosylamine--glycine ligase [Candidatus Omnitrophica bacterium]|nr:phosphoribosylamine--glycine ligase [Candidatus Omnitrophota bacterium]
MKVLVIGSGGREHALVWKIAQSPKVEKIYCAPGNAGILALAECVDIKADNLEGLFRFAQENSIDLTVVGPEIALCAGIVDLFSDKGLKVFGPDKESARLEGSKVFAKEAMIRFGIPTAEYRIFSDNQYKEAQEYAAGLNKYPIVIKADGLAAGKGVIIAIDKSQADKAVRDILVDKVFGAAGGKILIEECLQGDEASILAICDGEDFVILPASQDHKRVFDNDEGLNTGGMGAYSPANVVDDKLLSEVENKVIRPLLSGMKNDGNPYRGVLYIGLMITLKDIKVLEFNVRFGDPETQAVLPRIKTDLVDIMLAACENRLKGKELEIDARACVNIVMASGGYPGKYEKGKEITGLDEALKMKDVFVFHAGTIRLGSTPLTTSRLGQEENEFKYMTNGGRVLGVTGLGANIEEAISNTYEAVEKINFEGAHFRRDIGKRAIHSEAL